MKYIQGVHVSPGVAIGKPYHFRKDEIKIPDHKIENPKEEISRFMSAIADSKAKLIEQINNDTKTGLKQEKDIMNSYLTMLEDPELINLVESHIVERRTNAEMSLMIASDHFICLLEDVDDEYLKGRANDIRDVSNRILEQLMQIKSDQYSGLLVPSILVAEELTVNDIVGFKKDKILGIVTAKCGITDHVAIMARSYEIPMITGIENITDIFCSKKEIIIDGREGWICMDADKNMLSKTKNKIDLENNFKKDALSKAFLPAITKDEVHIDVYANIGSVENAEKAIFNGADGVGLFRTEFLFIDNHEVLDEETQFQYYKQVFNLFLDKEIIIRTLDLGGDKQIRNLKLKKEENPALGLRGLRLTMHYKEELLKPQINAILRAASDHEIKIMLPMVTSIDEVKYFKKIFSECKKELRLSGKIPEKSNIKIGIMIEVPSAAILADRFASEVDFFSIGTNDLTQYTLSADRTNAEVSYLNQGIHPAVLYLINKVVKSAKKYSKLVGICGELATDYYAIPILVGLGINEFSVNPVAIPTVKEIIRSLSFKETQQIVNRVLECNDWECTKRMIDSILGGTN